jgi:O-antigen ligase
VSAPELLGVLLACGAAAYALLARDPTSRYAAVGLSLAAAIALLAGEVWDQERFAELRGQPGVLVLGGLLAGTALGATAATFTRAPAAFAIAAFAVLPLRVPVQVGGETNFLLVPLYGVIAGGWLRGAILLARGRGAELQSASSPRAGEPVAVRGLALALAAALAVYGIGCAWTEDPSNAIRNVCFFLVPFAALCVLLRDLRWYRKLAGQVLLASAIVAVAFAALALVQHATRELLLNKDLKDANQLHLYFRVNSLFKDPNVLGRYLALVLVGVAAWLGWRGRDRWTVPAVLCCAVLLAALALTYSQSSFLALIAGLGLLVWLRLGARGLALAAGIAVAGIAALAIAGGPAEDAVGREQDIGEVTAGRTDLVSGGLELFADAPLAGQGSGAFGVAFRRQVEPVRKPVSHTEPVTVAAESGILGLVPYLAVLGLSLAALLAPWPGRSPARAAVAGCWAALLVHTLGYAGFLTDPATWALVALGVSLRE